MTLSLRAQTILLFMAGIILLTFNFTDHRLSTLSSERFADNEFASDRYVFSRLVYDLDHGTDAEGGLMLRHEHVDDLYKAADMEDYAAFKKKLPGKIVDVYQSHMGFQDDIIFPLWEGLRHIRGVILEKAKDGSRWQKRMQNYDLYYFHKFSQAAVALLNAIVISLIILWAARQYGINAGWFLLATVMIFMPPLTFFGRSLWWMMWVWFIPFVASLWAYHLNKGQPLKILPSLLLSTIVMGGVCLRGTMGYEYISTVGIAAAVPVIYYAMLNRWSVKTWFGQTFIIGLFALAGLAAALWLHWNVLAAHGDDPLAIMMERYQIRAHGGVFAENQGTAVEESIGVSTLAVIATYLYDPQKIAFPQILLMLPFLGWLAGYARGGRATMAEKLRAQYDALIAAIGIGLIGAISMLIVLKSHAAIHGFDIVVWNMPMNFFLALFYWQWLQSRRTA